jgi:hypothetical protein
MNATEMKSYLVEFAKTLPNKDKDEWWGTDRDMWKTLYPRFLMWFNSHHNRVKAKEAKASKQIEVNLKYNEANLIIAILDQNRKDHPARDFDDDLRVKLITKIQTTPGYIKNLGLIECEDLFTLVVLLIGTQAFAIPTAEEAKQASEKVLAEKQAKEFEEAWLYTEFQIDKAIKDGKAIVVIDLDCFSRNTITSIQLKLISMGYKAEAVMQLKHGWRMGVRVTW